jgi:hypothetical protein
MQFRITPPTASPVAHRGGNANPALSEVLAQFGNLSANTPIEYDAAGNRLSVPSRLDASAPERLSRTEQFTYDVKDRLTHHNNGNTGHSFTYDRMGNPTTFEGVAVSSTTYGTSGIRRTTFTT